ncbi:MAG TPA: hypothetical protein VNE67_08935 [Acetobacteraceae bacterium]|nr:hypothetical protein [Acetobacteraceae bacterium]
MPLKSKPAASGAPAGTNHPVIRDKGIIAAAEEYHAKKADFDLLEARLKELKGLLEPAMGGAPTAYAGTRILTRTDVPPLPATANVAITKDMIGQVIPGKKGRAGYTQLRVQ